MDSPSLNHKSSESLFQQVDHSLCKETRQIATWLCLIAAMDKLKNVNWMPPCRKRFCLDVLRLGCKEISVRISWCCWETGVHVEDWLEISPKCCCPWPGDVTSYQDRTNQGNQTWHVLDIILQFPFSITTKSDS